MRFGAITFGTGRFAPIVQSGCPECGAFAYALTALTLLGGIFLLWVQRFASRWRRLALTLAAVLFRLVPCGLLVIVGLVRPLVAPGPRALGCRGRLCPPGRLRTGHRCPGNARPTVISLVNRLIVLGTYFWLRKIVVSSFSILERPPGNNRKRLFCRFISSLDVPRSS